MLAAVREAPTCLATGPCVRLFGRKAPTPFPQNTCLCSFEESARVGCGMGDRCRDVPDRLLDVKEAGALLGLKPSTLYQWAYERRIPVVKPSGPRGPLRFRLSTLLELIESWERPALRGLPDGP
jgi:excisionase family DNA binding protein